MSAERYIGITGYPLEEFQKVLDQTPVKVNAVLSYCRNTLIDCTLKVGNYEIFILLICTTM